MIYLTSDKSAIVEFNDSKVSKSNLEYIVESIDRYIKAGIDNIYFDFKSVDFIDNAFFDFLEQIKSKSLKNYVNVSVCGLKEELMALFYLLKYDQRCFIYSSIEDAHAGKRPLIKRKFNIIK